MKGDSFKDFVLDQLSELRGVSCRAMFGGYGLYRDEVFFGIIHKGRLYFKTSETSRVTYIKKGMRSFRPNAKQMLKTYYEVPVDIIEDAEQLTAWARTAASSKRVNRLEGEGLGRPVDIHSKTSRSRSITPVPRRTRGGDGLSHKRIVQ